MFDNNLGVLLLHSETFPLRLRGLARKIRYVFYIHFPAINADLQMFFMANKNIPGILSYKSITNIGAKIHAKR